MKSKKYMYDASCFIECIESSGNSYITSCSILKQLKVKTIPKDLKDVQKILKSLLTKKKVILVFDNMKNKRKIEDVVSMHNLFISNGSPLIIIKQD